MRTGSAKLFNLSNVENNFVQVKVMAKQLLMFHNAVSAYFSGNQAALEESLKQFAGKVKIRSISFSKVIASS